MELTHEQKADCCTVFCAAMMAGYVAGTEYTRDPSNPNLRQFHFKDEQRGIGVVDSLQILPGSNVSCGRTVVYIQGTPVWLMQRDETYPEDLIPYLRKALDRGLWMSCTDTCRGPQECYLGSYLYYSNEPYHQSDFGCFMGFEKIVRSMVAGATSVTLGLCRYHGGFIV